MRESGGRLPSRAGRDYCRAMPALRRLLAVCALTLAAVLLAMPSPAGAQGYLDIYDDFVDNGVIDGDYPFARLQDALIEARKDVLFVDFANAVSDALDAQYLGGASGGGGGGAAAADSPLPEPQTPDDQSHAREAAKDHAHGFRDPLPIERVLQEESGAEHDHDRPDVQQQPPPDCLLESSRPVLRLRVFGERSIAARLSCFFARRSRNRSRAHER